MEIEILDSVFCKADKDAINEIKNKLKYKSVFWQKGPFKKKRIVKDAYFIDGRSGKFLTGLLPRVLDDFCGNVIEEEVGFWEPVNDDPYLEGITFKPEQERLMESAIRKQRGIVKSPTGSGKTIVAMGIMSRYHGDNILFLCHSISILEQTKKELSKFGFEYHSIGGKNGSTEIKDGITIASIQSFVKIDPKEYEIHYDIVMVDEAHHVCSRTSQYGKVLQNLKAMMKLGFTATLPEGQEKILAMEGLLGPVVDEVTIQDGIKTKMFVKPRITFIPVPKETIIDGIYKYQEIYKKAIVESKIRNKLVLQCVIDRIRLGKTSLIMVKDIDHGENLLDMLYEKYPNYQDDFLFIQGSTEKKTREEVRNALDKKSIKCVIVTAIWREGVNIKSLNTVLLALGGKSAIQVLQAIGRGTRNDEGKDEVEIIDFVDRYKYLSQHFTERFSLYLEAGWI